MLNDKPAEFHIEAGRLFFKSPRNWPVEELAQRLADIVCNSRFEPFRKNKGSDEDWTLDSGNNWWFHMAPDKGEGWYYIVHRYYHEPSDRVKLEALGAALVWLI